MNNSIIKNIIRALGFILIQVLVLRRINIGGPSFNYVSLLIYPTILILLPLRISKIPLLLIGFSIGLIVDFFYDSPGVHAATCVFICFIRPFILNVLTPRSGYNVGYELVPSRYGYDWFFKYAGIILFIHLFVYFSLLLFSPVYIAQIFTRTIISFLFTLLFILIYVRIFLNSK